MTVTAAEARHGRAVVQALLHEGDFPAAEARLSDLLDGLGTVDGRSRTELLRCRLDRVLVRRLRNDVDGALADLAAAEGLLDALPPFLRGAEEAGIRHVRGKMLAARADLWRDDEKRDEDRRRASECLGAVRAHGWEWQADELESYLAARAGDWARAAACAERAADALASLGWPAPTATMRRRAGEALWELGDPRAEALLREAHRFLDAAGPPDELSRAELALAAVHARAGDHEGAWARVQRSLHLTEHLARRFRALTAHRRFVADKAALYERAFQLALSAGGDTGTLRAWTVVERGKSFYLCQLLANADVPLFSGADPRDLARLTALEDRLDLLDAEFATRGGAADDSRGTVSAERWALLEALMAACPDAAPFRVPPALDLAAEIRRLAPDWTPVSYYWHSRNADGATLAVFWADTEGRPHHVDVPWSPTDLARLDAQRESLTDLVRSANRIVTAGIGAKLLPDRLRDDLPVGGRLLVSPHGRLRGFPIHASPVGDRRAQRVWSFQYIPSLGLLALPARRGAGDGVLLLGSPRTPLNPVELPQVTEEIDGIARVWGSGPGRSERAIVEADDTPAGVGWPPVRWGDFAVLHISCHGEFPADRPFDAALLLGRDAVRAAELFTVRLAASLVVLSACSLGRQTEDAEGVGGDEWLGLYLPLLYAGAERMLVSLWFAEADPARDFMVALHGRLADGVPADRAVTEATETVCGGPAAFWTNWYLVGRP